MMCWTPWASPSVLRAQSAPFFLYAFCILAWLWQAWKNPLWTVTMTSSPEISMRLEGQVAIVTGVSHAGQVGIALASAFVREGAMLAISSRTAGRVNARAEELRAEGAQVIAVPADLTTEEGANPLVLETLKSYGRIDILVNLAGGLTTFAPSAKLTPPASHFSLTHHLR